MQNLTSRYNILYNANILLDESIRNLESAYPEDYGQLLSVYKEPTEAAAQSISGNLDSILNKAKTIIDDKLYSSYVDDAYFLIGQANYYKARFFTAAEFFTYVHNSYPESRALKQRALIFQARSILQLDNFKEAGPSLDSAYEHLNDTKRTKRTAADLHATTAQFLIKTGREMEAIDTLKKAIRSKGSKKNKIRWTYVLAQLQERNNQLDDAYKNYTSVVKSNAPFDMAFSAGLNRISIEDARNGQTIDKIARLKSLLKDDKNKGFIDQIYYRIGDVHLSRRETQQAVNSYNTAIRQSINNQNQRGLSYLKIADIYFQQGDYIGAKAYYDSTLSTLSPSYPGYDLINKKGNNLELLANRFRVIGREDTLQTLAGLSEAERDVRIGALIREQMEKTQSLSTNNSSPGTMLAGIDQPNTSVTRLEGKFYFNNTTAISQGVSDFKRRWGNRALEDNWRRGSKTSADAVQNFNSDPDAPATVASNPNPTPASPENLEDFYRNNIPFTDSAMRASNQRIADSYYDIASFYRDELKDNTEAIKTFEKLLQRAPESTYTLSVYYNLYRLYQGVNNQKSDEYKQLILTKHPDSPFAKVIADPDFYKKSDEKEAALNNVYNILYELYSEKKYAEVLRTAAEIEAQYGRNELSPQLAYLQALAIGHTQKLDPFENWLQKIAATYPDDKLITPLVQQHLLYIDSNRSLFTTRTRALTEHNPFELVFEPEPQPTLLAKANDRSTPKAKNDSDKNPPKEQTTQDQTIGQAPAGEPISPTEAGIKTIDQTVKPKPLYDLPPVGEYYFVVNVENPGANLNSSRFGIGQFNRSTFSGSPIKHQLKNINSENQLIFIGPFDNYDAAVYYERSILALIKDIMKVPAEKYNTFVIVKPELDKLTTAKQINAYREFYKNSR